MFTPKEIRDTEFERVSRGYKVEDVDGFLARLADQLERVTSDRDEKDRQLTTLAAKLEEYRKDEDAVRSALISAERMRESILAEATQQQEIVLRDAHQKAEKLVTDAEDKINREEVTLNALKQQVATFKSEILNIYKSHLEILSDLPDEPAEISYDEAKINEVLEQAEQSDEAVSGMRQQIETFAQSVPDNSFGAERSAPKPAPSSDFNGFAPRFDEAPPMQQQQPEPPAPHDEPSVFASFGDAPKQNAPAEDPRFGPLDFGENFSFGRE